MSKRFVQITAIRAGSMLRSGRAWALQLKRLARLQDRNNRRLQP